MTKTGLKTKKTSKTKEFNGDFPPVARHLPVLGIRLKIFENVKNFENFEKNKKFEKKFKI